jgi:hypothetical protein
MAGMSAMLMGGPLTVRCGVVPPVVDTSVSLPATLSPRGMARKFWVLLALGALDYQVELELQEVCRAAGVPIHQFKPGGDVS